MYNISKTNLELTIIYIYKLRVYSKLLYYISVVMNEQYAVTGKRKKNNYWLKRGTTSLVKSDITKKW